jgi:iron complex outermembrane receptor protein
VTGTVVEAEGGTALVGAHVLLRSAASAEVVRQTATDACGDFAFDRVRPGRYVVEVQQLGYTERRRPFRLEVGESRALDVALPLKAEGPPTTVWAPSRQRERRLEAPVSVSVVEPERLWREAATSTTEALRSVPGVDVAQTGVARRWVSLRGGTKGVLGGPHVRVDHRAAAPPLLGRDAYGAVPVPMLDVRRMEVVRGPASALRPRSE